MIKLFYLFAERKLLTVDVNDMNIIYVRQFIERFNNGLIDISVISQWKTFGDNEIISYDLPMEEIERLLV